MTSASKIYIALLTTTALSACAPQQVKINDENDVSSAVEISSDQFKKITYFKGPRFSTSLGNAGRGVVEEVALDMMRDDKSSLTYHTIFVADYFSGNWRHYGSAYDIHGNKFIADKVGQDVWCKSGCSFEERLSIPVTREYLEEHAQNGITMKISGQGGEEVFSIPSGYIRGFLKSTQPSK